MSPSLISRLTRTAPSSEAVRNKGLGVISSCGAPRWRHDPDQPEVEQDPIRADRWLSDEISAAHRRAADAVTTVAGATCDPVTRPPTRPDTTVATAGCRNRAPKVGPARDRQEGARWTTTHHCRPPSCSNSIATSRAPHGPAAGRQQPGPLRHPDGAPPGRRCHPETELVVLLERDLDDLGHPDGQSGLALIKSWASQGLAAPGGRHPQRVRTQSVLPHPGGPARPGLPARHAPQDTSPPAVRSPASHPGSSRSPSGSAPTPTASVRVSRPRSPPLRTELDALETPRIVPGSSGPMRI